MKRLIQLDVLRAVAILLVLGEHQPVDPDAAGWFRGPAALLRQFGWTGVDLFFVLSGYLVGGLLMAEWRKTGRIDVGRFLVRRAFKIWPGYFALLTLLFVAETQYAGRLARRTPWEVLRNHWPSLVHVQNYFTETIPRAGHTWSLAVEEHFYLALPFVLIGLFRVGRLAVPGAAAFLLAVCAANRCLTCHEPPASEPVDWVSLLCPTHLRMDSLFLGVAVAYLAHFHPSWFARVARRRGLLLTAGLALVAPMTVLGLRQDRFVTTLGFTCLSAGYACLLILATTTRPGVGRFGQFLETPAARGLAWVGAASYPIYIWHMTLAGVPASRVVRLWKFVPLPDTALFLLTAALYLALAIVPASILGRWIDLPALRVRDRMFPPHSGSPVAPQPADEAAGTTARAAEPVGV